MSRRNPTAAIEARQRVDVEVRKYNQAAAENGRQKMISEWETKTTKTVESKELLRSIDAVQARHDDVLIQRRQRLADLLLREKQEHDDMLANLGESDEQRRERLMQKARDLRAQREELRKAEATDKLDQLFRERNDTIRQAESKIKVLYTADQRREQLNELSKRKEDDKQEEAFFTQMWLDEQRKQTDRARRDLEDTHTRAQRTQQDLAIQCEANRKRLEESRDRQRAEDADFFRLLREEQAASAAKDTARREHIRNLAAEIKHRNEELLRIKQEEYNRLRQEDKDALDELLRRIADDERLEAEKKKQHRERQTAHMHKVEAQMNAQAESETALDKLWQQENDKEWEKREARWIEEQNIRASLLSHVYETRKNQIRASFGRIEQEAEQKRAEYERLVAQVEALKAKDEAEARQRREDALKNQQHISEQIQRRSELKAVEKSSKKEELASANAFDVQYKQKLDAELLRMEQSKPEQFRGVPLVKSNQRFA